MDAKTHHDPMDLSALSDSLLDLHGKIDQLLETQRRLEELTREAEPILRAMTDVGIQKLAALEAEGWFAFGKEGVNVLRRIVEAYSPEDVAALGDNVVTILDTVRNVTQPDVLDVANEATEVLHHADEVQPVGMMGFMKATRDSDVQRGIAVAVEVLRHLGKRAEHSAVRRSPPVRAPRPSTPTTARGAAVTAPDAPKPAAKPAPSNGASGAACGASSGPAPGATHDFGGFTLDSNGFLLDPSTWNRDFAVALAVALGVGELGEQHWALVDFARKDYLDKGVSPNIRRISKGSGMETKAVYALFPKAPGKTISRIAGIPKPAGCV